MDYYPFGLPYDNQTSASIQPNKFGGKEFDTMNGLNMYDFHARQQDPLSGRFTTMDPLAEKYYHISPYAYCANNPVKFIDPDGMDYVLTFQNEDVKKAFTNTMNKQLDGQFEISLTEVKGGYSLGFVATESGGDLSKMSERGQAFYSAMKEGIDNHDITANIGVVYGKSGVNTGNWTTQEIDIADINQFAFNRGEGATQSGKIAHEFTEQFEKAKIEKSAPGIFKIRSDYGYDNAHKDVIMKYENKINGNERQYRDVTNHKGWVTQTYKEKNGSTSTVNINTTPIIKVMQVNKAK